MNICKYFWHLSLACIQQVALLFQYRVQVVLITVSTRHFQRYFCTIWSSFRNEMRIYTMVALLLVSLSMRWLSCFSPTFAFFFILISYWNKDLCSGGEVSVVRHDSLLFWSLLPTGRMIYVTVGVLRSYVLYKSSWDRNKP